MTDRSTVDAEASSAAARPNRAARGRMLAYVPRRSARLAAALLGSVGLGLLFSGAVIVVQGLRVRDWPAAGGVVREAHVTRDTIGTVFGRRYNYPMRQRRTHLSYSYVVAGEHYTGTRIGLRDDAARTIGPQPLFGRGQSVAVHYNPKDPADALLDSSIPWSNIANVILGGIAVVIAVRLARKAADY